MYSSFPLALTPDVFSQADSTPCILLCTMHNDQYLQVAKGHIEQPLVRTIHGKPIPPELIRITVSRVIPRNEEGPVPYPPDEYPTMKIGESKGWHLLWPKTHIRLDLKTTPQTTPDMQTAQIHPQTSPPLPPVASGQNSQEAGAPDRAEMSDDDDDPNWFLNTGCDIDNMGLEDDSPRYRDTDTVMPDRPQKEHPALECKKSLFAASQETPPDVAFTEPPANIISPNTILATATRAFTGGPATMAPKKGRKRGRSKVFATQPVPEKTIPIKDRIARNARKYHVSGTPILPPVALEHTTGGPPESA